MDTKQLAAQLSGKPPTRFRKKLVFAGSFDPFANHHRALIEELLLVKADIIANMTAKKQEVEVSVVVWPVGPYSEKQQIAPPEARMKMLRADLKGVDVHLELHDLEFPESGYTSTFEMQRQLCRETSAELAYEYLIVDGLPDIMTEVWHVVGSDNVAKIKGWDDGSRLWKQARFIVLARDGYVPEELPSNSFVLEGKPGSCSSIRELIANGDVWEHLVSEDVAAIIKNDSLYGYKKPATKRSPEKG